VVGKEESVVKKIVRVVESSKERLVSLDISDATLDEIFEALARKTV
jgi:hypothetical protein